MAKSKKGLLVASSPQEISDLLFCIYTIIMHKLFIEIISNHLLLLMID
jgi:hypothetical protein